MKHAINNTVVDQILRTDFHSFVMKAFQELYPGTRFLDNWSIGVISKAIADRVQWELGRLTISLPPRSLKSHIASVALPAFLLGQNPAAQVIVTSYTEALSAELAVLTRRLMERPFYCRIFPATRLAAKNQQLLTTTKGGSRRATSIEAATTGFGGDYIIVDDPLSASDRHSVTARDKANDYLDSVLMTRLNDPPGGVVLIVAQRLHEDDMIGHVMRTHGDWDHLSLPATAKEDIHISSDVGGPYDFRKGELLHPTRMPQSYLHRMRLMMGASDFEAQYQQNPVPSEGTTVLRDWLVYYDSPPDREGGEITLSLDTATKTDPANDYSACSVWLEQGGKHYLLYVWRGRVAYPDLKNKMRDLWAIHRADNLLIEDQGVGTALIQELRALGIPALARKTREPKEVRLSSVSSFLQSGLVILPRHASWLAEFVAELLGFPGAKHDDQVDTLSQYLAWVRDKPRAIFEYDFGEPEFSHEWLAQSILAARWG